MSDTTDDLGDRLTAAAEEHDGTVADLLTDAAEQITAQRDQVSELRAELEETNEGMVALTLELEEAEERYRSLFENAVEGIYKTTPDGHRYVMANQSMADVLGYESPAALQRAVSDVSEDVFVDQDRFEEYKAALREGEALENFEYRVRRRDGEIRWVSDNAKPLYDKGVCSGFRGGVIDITELKEYEERLETRNEELEALNRVVRHDISNDMQIIRSWAERLERLVGEEGERAIENILTTSDHIISLTDDAREFVETLTGPEEPEIEPVSLDEMLSYELERQRDAHEDATFRLTTEVPTVNVTANEMLSSVFRNLLQNAVQHNDTDDPTIEITCDVRDETVELRFADDGPGVPDERKEQIFGKGEQSIDSEGTGIGLYLVNQLVSNYGGDVWVEDREGRSPSGNRPQAGDRSELRSAGSRPQAGDNEPRGAVFVVQLPRADS
ncbi:ATP-binding protein [Halorientalis brevis]|uniref:histidine kinase n=1 Tax=Halorientalis brevis TaxID=1126241 RepID=A0ABD6CCH5_9EURY|nr:PAS domain-containing sensor histidine kinase [Halorientalis brevis]